MRKHWGCFGRLGLAGLFLLLWLPILSVPSWAQIGSQGTFVGTVKDASGGIIPNAAVAITNTATGVVTTQMTNADGIFRVAALPPGQYKLEASASGFNTEAHNVELAVGATQEVDFALQVGANVSAVTVSGEAPLVNTTNSTLSDVVNQQQVQNLPLNDRDYQQLFLLTPGVGNTTASTNSDRGNIPFQVAGGRPSSTRIMMDGTEFAGGSNTNTLPSTASSKFLGIESMQEFNIVQNNGDASVGKEEGGQVNIVTRSGSNTFHGSAYEFYRSDALDAKNFFSPAGQGRPKLVQNEYGASLGGPVLPKKKLFFFFNFEQFRDAEDIPGSVPVPDANTRNDLIEGVTTAGACTLTPVANTTAATAASLSVLNFYPNPSGGVQNFFPGTTCPNGTEQVNVIGHKQTPDNFYLGRIDDQISEKQSVFGRYLIQTGTKIFPQNDPLGQIPVDDQYRDQLLTLGHRYTFASQLLNEFDISFDRARYQLGVTSTLPSGTTIPSAFNFITPTQEQSYGVPGDPTVVDRGVVEIGTVGGGNTTFNILPALNDNASAVELHRVARQVWEGDDQLSKPIGKHFLQGGFQLQRIMSNELDGNDPAGVLLFNSLLQFAEGTTAALPATATTAAVAAASYTGYAPGSNSQRSYRQTYFGIYAQDSYKMRPNFTLNAGLRWELLSNPTESHGLLTQWYPIAGGDGACPNSVCYPTFPSLPYPASFSEPGLVYPASNVFTKNNSGNWAPRIGFAWNVFGSGKTSVRGGFGMYYDQIQNLWRTAESTNVPFYNAVTINAPPWPNPGLAFSSAVTKALSPSTIQPNPQIPTMLQYNLDIEQQIVANMVLTVGYVGSDAYHQARASNSQIPTPVLTPTGRFIIPYSTVAATTATPVNPALSGTTTFDTFDANSSYNALQVTLEKRISHGLLFKGVFAWAKTIEEDPDPTATTVGITSSGILSLPAYDRGLAAFSLNKVFTLNWVYDLPLGKHKGFTGGALNDWQFSGIYHQQSGLPFSPLDGSSQVFNGGSNATSGNSRPDWNPNFGGPVILGGVGPGKPYFAPQAFVPAPEGELGDVSAGALTGPGLSDVDLSLMKFFALTERFRLQFRVDAFDVLNHPNFELPSNSVFNSIANSCPTGNTLGGCSVTSFSYGGSAGIISQTLPDAQRELQFALKLAF